MNYKITISSIDNNEVTCIQPALDQVKAATENFTKNIIPADPRAPGGLSKEEVVKPNLPLILTLPSDIPLSPTPPTGNITTN